MPEISSFLGIRITMYYSEHNPPHFHAEYSGNRAIDDIMRDCVIEGALPGKQLKFVLAWGEMHKDELLENWELAKARQVLKKIIPLV